MKIDIELLEVWIKECLHQELSKELTIYPEISHEIFRRTEVFEDVMGFLHDHVKIRIKNAQIGALK
ncbi:hypothetical protein [Peribacillus loiseleuriae]|uniref:Uncharacterized protein n=1 Tax=Peribacillus loiseleuriae TaxID=1679170 RepID=A0A0K9GSM6_9BACI|nr:hypothetical protein [Peribacillus loiseleuriae]KMY49643.1 hypothetical protein AC625_08910 [Peribacillus loiseleuriae]